MKGYFRRASVTTSCTPATLPRQPVHNADRNVSISRHGRTSRVLPCFLYNLPKSRAKWQPAGGWQLGVGSAELPPRLHLQPFSPVDPNDFDRNRNNSNCSNQIRPVVAAVSYIAFSVLFAHVDAPTRTRGTTAWMCHVNCRVYAGAW